MIKEKQAACSSTAQNFVERRAGDVEHPELVFQLSGCLVSRILNKRASSHLMSSVEVGAERQEVEGSPKATAEPK